MRRSIKAPPFQVEFDGTPVAIAFLSVLGIVAVSFSPLSGEAQVLALGSLGGLGSGATGMAWPRGGHAGRSREEYGGVEFFESEYRDRVR